MEQVGPRRYCIYQGHDLIKEFRFPAFSADAPKIASRAARDMAVSLSRTGPEYAVWYRERDPAYDINIGQARWGYWEWW